MNINATLIGQSISFFFFVLFCMKFVWPPIMQALHDRKASIADSLAQAERGVHQQELAEKHASEVLAEAKQKAAEIIAQAQSRSGEIIEDSKDEARIEGQRLLSVAQAEIEQERNQARESLRQQVAALAVAGAEKILLREVDITAHNDVLEKVASEL